VYKGTKDDMDGIGNCISGRAHWHACHQFVLHHEFESIHRNAPQVPIANAVPGMQEYLQQQSRRHGNPSEMRQTVLEGLHSLAELPLLGN